MLNDGIAAQVPVFIFAHYGPAVYPMYWLQVSYSSVGVDILEVDEPLFFAVWCVNKAALVRTVYGCFALCQHLFPVIWTVYAL